jgi:type IX secretion system PorP/SprF family membrane protein
LKRPLVLAVIIFLSLNLCQFVYGQFIPYSQYYNAPLLTNPAAPSMTRYTEVEVHYRRSRIANYDLPSVSFLYPLWSANGLTSGGLGANVISQHAGPNGIYKVTGATAAFSYTIHVSKAHHLNAGISGGFISKKVDVSGITTDAQYNLNAFDPSLGNGEYLRSGSVTKPVINAGFYWVFTGLENQEKASLGVAAYNMNRPVFELMPASANENITYVVTGNIVLHRRGRTMLAPTFRYIWQGASIANIGCRMQYAVNANNKITVGAWYKTTKALVFSAQYNAKAYVISASTDLTVAPNLDASINNALEIGLGWRMLRKDNVNPDKILMRIEKPSRKRKLSTTPVSRKPSKRSNTKSKRDKVGAKDIGSLPKIEVIYFDSASTVVPADRIAFLEDLASALKNHPKTKLKITGHSSTDETIDNKQISQARINAVMKILMNNGALGSQLNTRAMSSQKPAGSNHTKAGRQKNRRVEFEWIKMK